MRELKAISIMARTNKTKDPDAKHASKVLIETIQQLEDKNEALRRELWRYKRKPAGRIGYLLLSLGAMALIWSVMSASHVPAFVGMALTFWGALLLFIRPVRYVKADLLSSTALPTLETINRIIKNLNYKGKGVYLPAKHFKGSKNGKLLILSEENIDIAEYLPPTEKIAQEEVFFKNPPGMCLTPSGADLTNLFEDELGVDFEEVDMKYLQTNLPNLFIEGLEIAKDFEMNKRGKIIRIKIWNSIYKDFCRSARKTSKNSCSSFACPLCSSIACALTRVTDNPIIIKKSKVSSKGEKIEVHYEIIEE